MCMTNHGTVCCRALLLCICCQGNDFYSTTQLTLVTLFTYSYNYSRHNRIELLYIFASFIAHNLANLPLNLYRIHNSKRSGHLDKSFWMALICLIICCEDQPKNRWFEPFSGYFPVVLNLVCKLNEHVWVDSWLFYGYNFKICDVIKQNESELANIVFMIQPNKDDSFFCFLLFVQSFNCLYFWNQLPNLCGVFTKLKPKQYPNRKSKKNKNPIFQL